MPMSSLSLRMSYLPDSTSLPSNVMWPADGGSIQLMHLTSVLLPEPEGPINTSLSLKSMSKLTPLMTSREPNDLCNSSTTSSFPCDTIMSPVISFYLLFEISGPLHDRRGHDQVDDCCTDVRREDVVRAGADDLRLEKKILHRDEGDQGSILDQRRKLIGKRRQNSPERLREDNVAQCLRPIHAQRESGFRLSLGDRFHSRSEDLRYVGCIAHCKRNHGGREPRQVQAYRRESIVYDQNQQQSRGPRMTPVETRGMAAMTFPPNMFNSPTRSPATVAKIIEATVSVSVVHAPVRRNGRLSKMIDHLIIFRYPDLDCYLGRYGGSAKKYLR